MLRQLGINPPANCPPPGRQSRPAGLWRRRNYARARLPPGPASGGGSGSAAPRHELRQKSLETDVLLLQIGSKTFELADCFLAPNRQLEVHSPPPERGMTIYSQRGECQGGRCLLDGAPYGRWQICTESNTNSGTQGGCPTQQRLQQQ